jgi:signal transduction histidine kinase
MKLRARLALTLLLSVLPLAAAVAWWQVRAQRIAFEEQTAELVRERMLAGERAVCEDEPETWPAALPPRLRRRLDEGFVRDRRRFAERVRRFRHDARRRGGELAFYAYDGSFASANPETPPFDPELRAELERGTDEASKRAPDKPDTMLVAVRMPWDDGPCSIVVVTRPAPPDSPTFVRVLLPSLVVSLAAILMAILAAGPIVRRIRKLTSTVERTGLGGETKIALEGNDEIRELAEVLDASRAKIRAQVRELEERDETLRRYVANTTHDVMLPLTVIQGHLTALERAAAGGEAVDEVRVKAALEECHYLGSLVHNLNVAAKLESGERSVQRHEVDLNELVERVMGRNGPYAEQRGVVLNHSVPGEPVRVTGDVTLIEQAIGNIVHNAVRYNRAGGHVAVILEAREGRFSLRVLDDGPGIDEAELARITERGFRGDRARSRHPTGMGLGLAITKDVVDRHGFTLTFTRPSDGGLEVRVEGALSG